MEEIARKNIKKIPKNLKKIYKAHTTKIKSSISRGAVEVVEVVEVMKKPEEREGKKKKEKEKVGTR